MVLITPIQLSYQGSAGLSTEPNGFASCSSTFSVSGPVRIRFSNDVAEANGRQFREWHVPARPDGPDSQPAAVGTYERHALTPGHEGCHGLSDGHHDGGHTRPTHGQPGLSPAV